MALDEKKLRAAGLPAALISLLVSITKTAERAAAAAATVKVSDELVQQIEDAEAALAALTATINASANTAAQQAVASVQTALTALRTAAETAASQAAASAAPLASAVATFNTLQNADALVGGGADLIVLEGVGPLLRVTPTGIDLPPSTELRGRLDIHTPDEVFQVGAADASALLADGGRVLEMLGDAPLRNLYPDGQDFVPSARFWARAPDSLRGGGTTADGWAVGADGSFTAQAGKQGILAVDRFRDRGDGVRLPVPVVNGQTRKAIIVSSYGQSNANVTRMGDALLWDTPPFPHNAMMLDDMNAFGSGTHRGGMMGWQGVAVQRGTRMVNASEALRGTQDYASAAFARLIAWDGPLRRAGLIRSSAWGGNPLVGDAAGTGIWKTRPWSFLSSVPEANIIAIDERRADSLRATVGGGGGRRYLSFPATFEPGTRIRFRLVNAGAIYCMLDDEPTLNTPRHELNPSGGWPAGTHIVDYTVPAGAAGMTYLGFLATGINYAFEVRDFEIVPATGPLYSQSWRNWSEDLQQSYDLLTAEGYDVDRIYICFTHQEADWQTPRESYLRDFLAMKAEREALCAAAFPGAQVHWFVDQASGSGLRTGTYLGGAWPSRMAIQDAAVSGSNGGNMTMVMPRYWMDFGMTVGGALEDIHHSYRSRIWQGEMYGHAMHALEMGQTWRCPVMTSATVSGNSVVVNFDSLEPLVIDPTFCKVRPDMGFTIGNGAVVTGVRLTGQRQVTVDCASAPASSINYAYRTQDGQDVSDRWPIATGAIRDAWQADSLFDPGKKLVRAAVGFQLAL